MTRNATKTTPIIGKSGVIEWLLAAAASTAWTSGFSALIEADAFVPSCLMAFGRFAAALGGASIV
jgi:hypothetical protein